MGSAPQDYAQNLIRILTAKLPMWGGHKIDKMNGIELIAKERKEQIEKHGITTDVDVKENSFAQLSEAAAKLIMAKDSEYPDDVPFDWNDDIWAYMITKNYKNRLIMAGALIAAEIDRLIALAKK